MEANEEPLVLKAIDYDSMPYCSSKTALRIATGVWQEDIGEAVYAELAVTVTKNYSGPTFVCSASAGLFKVTSDGKAMIEHVDFHIGEVSASAGISETHAEAGAKVTFVGGDVSIFNVHIGAGVSNEVGIKDDSIALKAAGCGFKIGRKLEISVFDNSFGIDFGKLFN